MKGHVTILFKFRDSYISRERLKLEISNMINVDHERRQRKKCKTRSQGVGKRSCDLLLEFWDSLSIMRTVEARNLKFKMQIGHEGYTNEKNAN